MRECWINVYERRHGGHIYGAAQASRQVAEWVATKGPRARPVYRLHVRFKPEAIIYGHVRDLLGAC